MAPLARRLRRSLGLPAPQHLPLDEHTPEVVEDWAANSGFDETIEVLSLLINSLQPTTIIEVGTNSGYVMAATLRQVQHQPGRVIGCEPAPHLAEMARQALSNYPGVSVIQVAVGSAPGSAELYCDLTGNFGWNTFRTDKVVGAMHPIEVTITTLTSLFDELEITRAEVLKIDVEGFEVEVLDGAWALFDDPGFRPTIMLEVAWAQQNKSWDRQLRQFCRLRELGYRFFGHDGAPIEPEEQVGTFDCICAAPADASAVQRALGTLGR